MAHLEFWFEFASTYSYPAALRIEALAREAGVRLVYRPFLLGPIFAAHGMNDSPFNLNPVKGRYMWRDLERTCALYELPWRRPSVFPRPSVTAARLALLAAEESWGPSFVRAVYRKNFVDDQDIASVPVLAELLREHGQDAERWLARANEPDTKASLRAQTERAQALGIFGAPSFVVGDELFWGNDRLEQALAWAARI
jgi:2-hydroxychromene-2-carboxylate isomerase